MIYKQTHSIIKKKVKKKKKKKKKKKGRIIVRTPGLEKGIMIFVMEPKWQNG